MRIIFAFALLFAVTAFTDTARADGYYANGAGYIPVYPRYPYAAEQMGITGDDAANYAREVVKADLAEPGDEDVFRKIRADFDAKGVGQSDHQIRRMMTDFMVEAIGQIESEAKG